MDKKCKTLIIKTGYSEILEDRNNSRKVSLGDVLRTTPLLWAYRDTNVTWVTDNEAFPLLEGNPLIQKLLPYDFTTAEQLKAEEFDTVINLEKIPGICALAERIKTRRSRYGFIFDSQTGEALAFDRATDVLAVSADAISKKENTRTTQELLFEMVGKKWAGEEYILGYKPRAEVKYDVALNTQIGQKWPTKAWPASGWDTLEAALLSRGLKVTRQDKQPAEVLKSLNAYMDWISSARMIVSNDSLGLHLGIAMKKRVLGLFGPTPYKEVFFYGRGEAIAPISDCPELPCFRGKCKSGKNCISAISPAEVENKVLNYLI